MKLLPVTDETFEELALTPADHDIVLVKVSASWCGPCKVITPLIEEIADEFSDSVAVYSADVETFKDTGARYGLSSVPTLMVMKAGELVAMRTGGPKKGFTAYKEDIQGLLTAALK